MKLSSTRIFCVSQAAPRDSTCGAVSATVLPSGITRAHSAHDQLRPVLLIRLPVAPKVAVKSPAGSMDMPPSVPSPATNMPVPAAGAYVRAQVFVQSWYGLSNASAPSRTSTGTASASCGIENAPAPVFTIFDVADSARGTAPSQLHVGTSTVIPFAPTTKFVTPDPAPPNHSVTAPAVYGMSVASSKRTRLERTPLPR